MENKNELSVRDAAYHTVRAYPGGASALAARMQMSPAVLAHKVAPNDNNRNYLSLEDSVTIQQMTGDFRILHAMARELEHVCILVGQADINEVNANISATVKEFGEFLTAVADGLSDQKITDNEMRNIDKQLGEMMNQANQLRAQLYALNKSLRPVIFTPRSKARSV